MTPGYHSKILLRFIGIALGGLALGFVVTKGLIAPIGHWYEMNRAQSESDLTRAFAIALAIQVLCVVAGGWLGNRLFCRWRQKRLDRR
ncbi:hypothetical protein [Variovorax sp. CAN15]|uniref:hypothetical protein n=1 Tax=Variovorax sp. CAN15 TaxID=3046727 RepID=UPI002647012E|nr:hypothetical protein [Variovorax sp. CAN15]